MDKAREETTIPVIAEELEVTKQAVETGRGIRVQKTVHAREHTVDEPLIHETVEVDRVPVGRVVSSAPSIRYEGDTTIVPVLVEEIVVEKRMVLKEEIHIRKTRATVRDPQTVTLREEHAAVERFGVEQVATETATESARVRGGTQMAEPAAAGSLIGKVFSTEEPKRKKKGH